MRLVYGGNKSKESGIGLGDVKAATKEGRKVRERKRQNLN